MAVRDRRGTRPDTIAVDHDRLIVVFDDEPARPPRLARRLGLAGLALALVVVGAGSLWLTRGDNKVEARPVAQAVVPAPPTAVAPLAVSVRAPARVVAGQPARFVVSYTDGHGIFAGGVEDWGDTGVGSVSLAACDASPPAAAPLHASYVATHSWRKAATYPVSFAVTTYTCSNGRATEETRNARVTVVVNPR
jgi:hypothetical protein